MSHSSIVHGMAYLNGLYSRSGSSSVSGNSSAWTTKYVRQLCNNTKKMSSSLDKIASSLTKFNTSVEEFIKIQKELSFNERMMMFASFNSDLSCTLGDFNSLLINFSESGISIPSEIIDTVLPLLNSCVPYCSIEDFKEYINNFVSFAKKTDNINEIEQESKRIKGLIPFTLGNIMDDLVPVHVKYVLCKLRVPDSLTLSNGLMIKKEYIWKMASIANNNGIMTCNIDINYNGNIRTPLTSFEMWNSKEVKKEVFDPWSEKMVVRTELLPQDLSSEYVEMAQNEYQIVHVINDVENRVIKFIISDEFIKAYQDAYLKYYSELSAKLSSLLNQLRIHYTRTIIETLNSGNDITAGSQKK